MVAQELTRILAWLAREHPEEETLHKEVLAFPGRSLCGSLAAALGGLTRHVGGRLLLQETCYGEGESLGFQTVGLTLPVGEGGAREGLASL